jgi:hypothetical protein
MRYRGFPGCGMVAFLGEVRNHSWPRYGIIPDLGVQVFLDEVGTNSWNRGAGRSTEVFLVEVRVRYRNVSGRGIQYSEYSSDTVSLTTAVKTSEKIAIGG